MTIKIPTIVKIIFGKDHFEFKACQVRIKWDQNSFVIEGVMRPNVVKVEEKNVNKG